MQLEDKTQIELKSIFNIKIETNNALHENIFSHAKIRYKYPVYLMNKMILTLAGWGPDWYFTKKRTLSKVVFKNLLTPRIRYG